MAKKLHSYELGDNKPSPKLEEPAVAYISVNLRDNYLGVVSEELFRSAISKAVSDFENGLAIPHNKIDELVKTRMRWKQLGHP